MAKNSKVKLCSQAKKYLLKNHNGLGVSRHASKKSGNKDLIHSKETMKKYVGIIGNAANYLKVKRVKHITPELAQAYLQDRARLGVTQKTLDGDKRALSLFTKTSLEKVKALTPQELNSRYYTNDQVQEITKHQNDHNALATCIALDAGLRCRELLTLRPVGTGKPQTQKRTFTNDRFKHRPAGVKYLVTGKGGLVREVQIAEPLAELLEHQRLEQPRTVKDGAIKNIAQYYNIGGGNAWANSFGRASKRGLGWSNGGHGLRHSYAKNRMENLQNHGLNYYAALEIVAQEMGHFRGSVTKTYLR